MSKKKLTESSIHELERYNADRKKRKDEDKEDDEEDEDDEDEDNDKKNTKKKESKKKDSDDEYNSEDSDEEEDDEEEEQDPQQLSKEFNKNVVAWVKTDNQQFELKKTVQKLNKTKREAFANISGYLTANNIFTVKISDGMLKLEKKESQMAMKEEHLAEFLEKKLKDKAKALKWAEEAFNSRKKKTSYSLKRIKK